MSLPAHIGDYTDFYYLDPSCDRRRTTVPARSAAAAQLPLAARRPTTAAAPRSRYRGSRSRARSGSAWPPGARQPLFGRSQRLDYELELGVFIGRGNELGTRIGIGAAESHVFGLCLLNDWSARDLQAWEYQPLGPFLGKNFATTHLAVDRHAGGARALSRALAARGGRSAPPLPYLRQRCGAGRRGAFDIRLEVLMQTAAMRSCGTAAAHGCHAAISVTPTGAMAQMVAHHTRQRLQPAQRRSARHRHPIGARARGGGLAAGALGGWQAAGRAAQWRDSAVSSRTATASSCAARASGRAPRASASAKCAARCCLRAA